jgi:hypothetical protein
MMTDASASLSAHILFAQPANQAQYIYPALAALRVLTSSALKMMRGLFRRVNRCLPRFWVRASWGKRVDANPAGSEFGSKGTPQAVQ